jgi:hypothetical protein
MYASNIPVPVHVHVHIIYTVIFTNFTSMKKKFEGLLEIVFSANAFKLYKQLEYIFQKC